MLIPGGARVDRGEVLRRLRLLAAELERRGVEGHIFLVDGAAMAVAYNARRTTRDIDAVFQPKQVIYEAARALAEADGWLRHWLNDAVKGFLAGEDAQRRLVVEYPGLQVYAASPRYLLAMKCLASRREDEDDIKLLLQMFGIRSVDDALKVVLSFYPQWRVPQRTIYMLDDILATLGEGTSSPQP